MLPLPVARMDGVAITSLSILLHHMNELRLFSAYFKFIQMRPDFGKLFLEILTTDSMHIATVSGQPLHWRTLQRFYGLTGAERYAEVFEPHVNAEDLLWQQAEDVLYKIEPALMFWKGLDFMGVVREGKKPLSFNMDGYGH